MQVFDTSGPPWTVLATSPPCEQALTRVSHELAGDFLVAAAAAEDLSAQAAVVAAPERGELLVAVVALLALAVRHPVLLQVTVLQSAKTHSEGRKDARTLHYI